MKRMLITLLFAAAMIPAPSEAQYQPYPDGGQWNPATDPDIDMYLHGWRDSLPRMVHGLEVKDVLVKGDGLNPTRPGAVLPYIDSFSYARLEPRATAKSEGLTGTQEIYYILAGSGTVAAGKQTAELHPGVAVFMPMGLPFEIVNEGESRLEMYLVIEPVPQGFKPRADMLVKDANTVPIDSILAHWWMQTKQMFTNADGLAQVENVLQVTFDPMTIGHPHVFPVGQLEIWSQASGTTTCFIGKQVRIQEPGMAYQVPPDGKTAHSNINSFPDTEAVFFYVLSQPKQ